MGEKTAALSPEATRKIFGPTLSDIQATIITDIAVQ
jgi:hypothetical protein